MNFDIKLLEIMISLLCAEEFIDEAEASVILKKCRKERERYDYCIY